MPFEKKRNITHKPQQRQKPHYPNQGKTTMVRNISKYVPEIHDLLNSSTYRKLSSDLTSHIFRKLLKNSWNCHLYKKKPVVPSARYYGLPKVHKPGIPVRLIASH